jgi:internalin A
MQKLGEADRVFIFVSNKYLKSPFCMYELFEMWRNSKQSKAEFLRHVQVFTIDGASIGGPSQWLDYTKFWKQERDALRQKIDDVGWIDAGEEARK